MRCRCTAPGLGAAARIKGVICVAPAFGHGEKHDVLVASRTEFGELVV
jgi:hypothetical protein